MLRLPSALEPLKAIIMQFQFASSRGTLDASLDQLVSRLDAVATGISNLAKRFGKKDTDTSDIVADFGGEATAVGEDTYSAISMTGRAADVGLVSYAVGKMSTTAAATTSGDSTAFASTTSYADIVGADLVLIFNEHGELAPLAGADVAYSTSTTTFIAIDLEFWDGAPGPIVIEASREKRYDTAQIEIHGNTATVEASLQAVGKDTLVLIDSSALAIENTLSAAATLGMIGLGD